MTHATRSGVAHLVAATKTRSDAQTRALLSFIPQNNLDDPPRYAPTTTRSGATRRSTTIVPDAPNKPYDMQDVIDAVVDDGDFFEISRNTREHRHRFGRVDGRTVGIVANQPKVSRASSTSTPRQGRALRALLRRFNIPLVTFVDVPGFLPGTTQEYGGIIKHGAKLLYAFAEATVRRSP